MCFLQISQRTPVRKWSPWILRHRCNSSQQRWIFSHHQVLVHSPEFIVEPLENPINGLQIHCSHDSQAKEQESDVFGAGTDSSATTLVWVMTELIRHPQVMKKLQHEVREVTKGKPHITDEDLQKMPYLKAVIKETFRLHPTVAIYFRAAREDVNLMGYVIESETVVLINAWAIGRDPSSWQEPDEFMPERFLNSSIDFRGFDFQLIPFGAGRRICPGLGFATAAIENTVANLVRNFDFGLPGGAKGEDLDASERHGFTIGKKDPLIVVPSRVSP